MALTPTQLKLIGKGGEIAGGAIGTGIATRKTEADIANIDKIAELQRKQELGMLGLSDQERLMLEQTYGGQLRDIGAEGEARRRQQMASYDIFGGAALQQAALTDASLAEAQAKATAAITQADLQRKAQQEAELQKRLELEGKRESERQKAFGGLVAKGITDLSTLPSEKIEEEGQLNPVLIKAIKEKFNFSSDREATDFAKLMKEDPEMAMLLGGTL